MEFKDFAQLLRPIIGGGSSASAFVKTLFESIVDSNYELAKETIDNRKTSSYKSYYYGENSISGIAKEVIQYLSRDEFIYFCNDFSDDVSEQICNVFKPYLPDIDMFNVGESLANLFVDIIKEAANGKRKKSEKMNNDKKTDTQAYTDGETEKIDEQVIDSQNDENKNTNNNPQSIVIQNGEHNNNWTNNGVINITL